MNRFGKTIVSATLALVVAEAVVLLWRIRDEEALLRREFAAEWDAYARASWRLVPFVY